MPAAGRIALALEYDGCGFLGWQSQPGGGSVQDAVQEALAAANNGILPVVQSAGRTDAGVHATLQIAHFDPQPVRPPKAWAGAANAALPSEIRVLWAHVAPPGFHARNSAMRRFYQYVLFNRACSSALMHGRAGFFAPPLDAGSMDDAAKRLLGTHDFSCFRAASCEARTPIRTMHESSVRRRGETVIFDFCADGFLHHMIRNIVGALLHVGSGRRRPEWVDDLLRNKDRTLSAPTAAAAGLYFTGAEYLPHFAMPEHRRPPLPISASQGR